MTRILRLLSCGLSVFSSAPISAQASPQSVTPVIEVRSRDARDSMATAGSFGTVQLVLHSVLDSLRVLNAPSAFVRWPQGLPVERQRLRYLRPDSTQTLRFDSLPPVYVQIDLHRVGFARVSFVFRFPDRCRSVVEAFLQPYPRDIVVAATAPPLPPTPPPRVKVRTCPPDA